MAEKRLNTGEMKSLAGQGKKAEEETSPTQKTQMSGRMRKGLLKKDRPGGFDVLS